MNMINVEYITPATVKETVAGLKKAGMSAQDIEDMFKNALKAKYIGIDVYYKAMVAIYEG